MSSLYLRGSTWWAKSYEQGKIIRWSLKMASRAEAKRRIKLYDFRPREEPLPSRLGGGQRGTKRLPSYSIIIKPSARGVPTRQGGCLGP